MRILYVTPSYYPAIYWGGPIFSVYEINKALAAIPGIELKVLTTDSAGPNIGDRLETSKLDYSALYPNYSVCFSHRIAGHSASLELLLKLPSLIKWSDAVHISYIYSFPTIPTLLLARIWHKPLVWALHGTLLRDKKFPKKQNRNLKRLWMSICNAIVQRDLVTLHTTSEEEKAVSMPQIRNANAIVLRHGVASLASLSKREFMPRGTLRLLFIGRLDPVKAIENLLSAMKQLDDPSVTLSIYGNGDTQYVSSLKQYAHHLDLLDKRVHFLGQADDLLKRNALLTSDVSIFPSYSENFGMAIAESLAHGVPVIVSRGTPWKSVEDKGCGLWVDNSPESLVRAIRTIRKMELHEMGKRGWQWMKEDYSWSSIGTQLYAVYKTAKESVVDGSTVYN